MNRTLKAAVYMFLDRFASLGLAVLRRHGPRHVASGRAIGVEGDGKSRIDLRGSSLDDDAAATRVAFEHVKAFGLEEIENCVDIRRRRSVAPPRLSKRSGGAL